jgi:glycosyltransferase involved in cell wall biosynthesis
MKKIRILMLYGGPKYDLSWEFGAKLNKLSQFSYGDVITTSSSAAPIEVGEYVVRPVDIKGGRTPATRFHFFCSILRLFRQARREGRPIDLVITYDPMATGLPGLIFCKLFGAKLVCEVYGEYSALLNYSKVQRVFKKKLKRFLLVSTARFVLKRAAGVKTLFPNQLELIGVRLREDQVAAQFASFVMVESFENLEEEQTILLVGYPLYVKGVDIAVAAFKSITDQFPDWRLKIMGYYPDRTEIDALIGDHPRIFIQPPVLHRNVNEHFGRCGIFLLPSRTEGLPRVLIEAMAAGKPLVASRVNGIPLVFDDNVEGFLVAPENSEEVAEALQRLMSDASLRKRMSAAAVVRARSQFSEDIYTEKFKEFVARIMAA